MSEMSYDLVSFGLPDNACGSDDGRCDTQAYETQAYETPSLRTRTRSRCLVFLNEHRSNLQGTPRR